MTDTIIPAGKPKCSLEELKERVDLHAKTRGMNRVLAPELVASEAAAIVDYEAAKAKRDRGE